MGEIVGKNFLDKVFEVGQYKPKTYANGIGHCYRLAFMDPKWIGPPAKFQAFRPQTDRTYANFGTHFRPHTDRTYLRV